MNNSSCLIIEQTLIRNLISMGSVIKDLNVKKGYGIIGKKQNGEESEMPVLDTTFFSALMI